MYHVCSIPYSASDIISVKAWKMIWLKCFEKETMKLRIIFKIYWILTVRIWKTKELWYFLDHQYTWMIQKYFCTFEWLARCCLSRKRLQCVHCYQQWSLNKYTKSLHNFQWCCKKCKQRKCICDGFFFSAVIFTYIVYY